MPFEAGSGNALERMELFTTDGSSTGFRDLFGADRSDMDLGAERLLNIIELSAIKSIRIILNKLALMK